ncbi:alpha-galactosidase [Candidatus Xianfuyuplasma coldseepsis]|uniref:Alpha-galactosidase n=1 Tax=Candidatus Xianfuyuplasma coldseepsis TaxID=2782163 RepID=A0A7L7KNM8_9MOLU|nr:alpha-galactosidase [Xianfuyuplasma coldseepsis]QMS84350.1 alpha-galactosidase [Xianfuyuplasma coldseepsis]
MIRIKDRVFFLDSMDTTYGFMIDEQGHLEHLYYGAKLDETIDYNTLRFQSDFEYGSATSYSKETRGVMLNEKPLEVSSYGKGDYREPTIHLELPDGSRTVDLTYVRHSIAKSLSFQGLPQADKDETLVITLEDKTTNIELELFYTVLEASNMIVRNMRLYNRNDSPIILDKILSMNLDMPNNSYLLSKLDGAWIRERHIHDTPLLYGTVRFDSKKGVSSSNHNPFFVLKEPHTTDEFGRAYGAALIYSGNYETSVEINPHDMLRINMGINSFDFRYKVEAGRSFITPEVLLTYSNKGLNQLTQQFHQCINDHIVSKEFRYKERPIVINNWEATYFDFNEKKLLAIAKQAKRLGIELLCLDDGWFGNRDDDTSSLGDWTYNPKKIKHGLQSLASKINKIGLDFGLWVEPEMVSENSEMYRAHPSWVIRTPHHEPSQGRHQWMLDLTNPDVVEHLKSTLTTLFQSANITYVKWDMNRNISDVYSPHYKADEQGRFHHDYICGLYHVLDHLKTTFPTILFESCSSGGNRFDLGMLYYMPQTWTSDNTDAYERTTIQEGTSLLYPLSTISNHVSGNRSHQTFRHVPLESRFNVACFGILGYELDVTALTPFERRLITRQIEYYKEHRTLFQFGRFSRLHSLQDQNHTVWMVDNEDDAQVLYFQQLFRPNDRIDVIRVTGLESGKYRITNREQAMNIRHFGSLVNRALPIHLRVNSWLHNAIANRYLFPIETVDCTVDSIQLEEQGFILPHPFTGTDHGEHDMILEDFGSRLYRFEKIND